MNPFVADPNWGIWIVLYFYLGGIAAGAYFVATLISLFGREEDNPISRIGYRLSLPLIMICGVLLIVDLERPERFWHMLFQSEVVHTALDESWPLGGWGTMLSAANLKHWSPMSIGAWALALFGLCSTLSVFGTLWPGGRLDRFLLRGVFGRLLQIAGSAVGFFVGSYTGVLLTTSNQPVWSVSDWIGSLFLTSSASTGIAAVLLLARGRAISPVSLNRLGQADLSALLLELGVFLVFFASLGRAFPWLLSVWPGWMLIGALAIGVLLPLWLDPREKASAFHGSVATGAALIGGLALRVGMLEAGPSLLARWADSPPEVNFWLLALAAVVAALIAMSAAYVLRSRVRIRLGALVMAAGVIVVLVIVAGSNDALFSNELGADHPFLERFAYPWLSPEDGRPRDGGAGASPLNRPTQPHLRTKIPGAE
jgi:formate-dependent nitrite reductase membrane component NrfD